MTQTDSKPEKEQTSSTSKVDSLLLNISEAVSGCIGDDYFEVLVKTIAQQLNMDIVFIGMLNEGSSRSISTLKLVVDGKMANNISYDLAGTPCDNIIDQTPCIYPCGIQEAFPDDVLLQELGIQGYMGAPLFASSGKPIGILVTLNRSMIQSMDAIAACFKMVAGRTAA